MNDLEYGILRGAVLNALRYGVPSQALGVLQGAGMVADVSAYSDELEALYSWAFLAGSCAIDRQFDDAQRKAVNKTVIEGLSHD